MTEQKMNEINVWAKSVDKSRLEVQDKMIIADATVKMLEALEPVYDKYNQAGTKKVGFFERRL
jgi:hypothetical protein